MHVLDFQCVFVVCCCNHSEGLLGFMPYRTNKNSSVLEMFCVHLVASYITPFACSSPLWCLRADFCLLLPQTHFPHPLHYSLQHCVSVRLVFELVSVPFLVKNGPSRWLAELTELTELT